MFKNNFKIAFFNLFRRKSRSIAVILMIAFGIAMMMLTQGLYEGMIKQMIQSAIRTGTGDIEICKKGYYESQLLSDYLPLNPNLEKFLDRDQNIFAYTYRLKTDGLISSAAYSQGIKIFGIIPKREKEFLNYHDAVVSGNFDLDPYTAIIGYRVADKLKVKIGKKIVINAQSLDKELTAAVFRIKGIIKTNNPAIDEGGVLIDLPTMQKMFKVNGISEYNILVKDQKLLEATKEKIKQGTRQEALGTRESSKGIPLQGLKGTKSLSRNLSSPRVEGSLPPSKITSSPGFKGRSPLENYSTPGVQGASPLEYSIFTWKDVNQLLVFSENIMIYYIIICYAIVFMVVAIGLFNIIFISVLERIREYGILIAIGTKFKHIFCMIMFESMILCSIGYFFGALLGLLLLLYLNIFGLNLSFFAQGLNSWGMASIIYSDIKLSYFIIPFVAVFLTAIISALYPAWKLWRLKPVEAIRFN